ncbi:MAG: hypothetical protein AAFX87_20130 [Bacteroidota bacterium]
MKNVFILCLLFISNHLYSQSENSILVRTNIGYSSDKILLPSTIAGNTTNVIQRQLNWRASGGIQINKNLILGAGLGILRNVSEQNSFGQTNANAGFISITTTEDFTATTTTPFIFGSLFGNLSEKIIIAGDLHIGYNFTNENVVSASVSDSGTGGTPITNSNRFESELRGYNVSIVPSVRFKLFKNAGLDLAFGNIGYTSTTSDSRFEELQENPSNFRVNFNPSSWLLGFFIEL